MLRVYKGLANFMAYTLYVHFNKLPSHSGCSLSACKRQSADRLQMFRIINAIQTVYDKTGHREGPK